MLLKQLKALETDSEPSGSDQSEAAEEIGASDLDNSLTSEETTTVNDLLSEPDTIDAELSGTNSVETEISTNPRNLDLADGMDGFFGEISP